MTDNDAWAAYERFENALKAVKDEARKGPVIDVLDTAYLVKLWLDAYAKDATAADIGALTAIIMPRISGETRPRKPRLKRQAP
jgi:hypothetical protein